MCPLSSYTLPTWIRFLCEMLYQLGISFISKQQRHPPHSPSPTQWFQQDWLVVEGKDNDGESVSFLSGNKQPRDRQPRLVMKLQCLLPQCSLPQACQRARQSSGHHDTYLLLERIPSSPIQELLPYSTQIDPTATPVFGRG